MEQHLKYLICDIDGQKVKVLAQIVDGKLWINYNGKTFAYSAKKKSARKGSGAAVGNGEILAPMPGKITKINVKNGDSIEAGKVVLVMEAMKMEYTLKAAVAGKIEGLKNSVGDQVKADTCLMVIK